METIRISAKSIIKGEVAICLLLLFLYGYRQAVNVIRTMSQVTEVHKIAITFDDGPHPVYTPRLLEGLEKRGVVATFFVTGENAAQYPDIIKRMDKDGHLIGNHTYTHIQLTSANRDKFRSELVKTNETLKQISG